MRRECNYHVLEIDVAINKLFYRLKDIIPDKIVLKTHTVRKVNPINEHSTLGQQIKYYRVLLGILQTELAQKLGCSRFAIQNIENKEIKLANVDFIKRILDELNIKDKVIINDEYISFLLDNPKQTIFNLRKQMNLTRPAFASIIGVSTSAIKDWETGRAEISRTSYAKLKKCMS